MQQPEINIRKAQPEDLGALMEIIGQAVESLRERGVDQWQDGYPNEEVIREDIRKGISYVVCTRVDGKEKIIATAAISFEPEETYADIYDGSWRAGLPYAVIHRIATAESCKGRGAAGALIAFVRESCRSRGVKWMRIDTHRDNLVMQNFLEKHGFEKCGSITLADGSHRFGFDAPTEQ